MKFPLKKQFIVLARYGLVVLFLLSFASCSPQKETLDRVYCEDFPYEECQSADQCVWQFSDLDPQGLTIMSEAYCREL